MKTTVTYEDVYRFLLVSQAWLKDPKNHNTKLGYAIQRMIVRADRLWRKYNDLLADLNIDYCSTDDNGIIITKGEQYQFTKENAKERNKKQRELYESEVEIEPYYATSLPPTLTATERLAFVGFVLREEDAEESAVEFQQTEPEGERLYLTKEAARAANEG